ncbi:MAG: sensor histidine kinase [Ignavibacteriaceae bacterium]
MSSNPILSRERYLIFYIIFWLIVASIFFALYIFELKINFDQSLIESLVFSSILCGLGLSYWFPSKYISFENKNLFIILLDHLFAGILSSIIWLSIGYFFIAVVLNYSHGFSSFFFSTLVWRFIIGVIFYFLITFFYYLVIYYNNFHDKMIREAELKNLIIEAEIKTLKFQINPHFIFNSLNSMSALTTINPDKAREMILKLAEFLRFTLANNDRAKNSFGDELKNIKLYLEIEKIRFEDKFELIEEIDECCKDALIPNMILQPLFENAIKHAVYETLSNVTLKLICRKDGDYLKISLENNYESNFSSKNGTGIGLHNIQERLRLIYNMDNLLELYKENNLFKVTLFIPLQNS